MHGFFFRPSVCADEFVARFQGVTGDDSEYQVDLITRPPLPTKPQ